MCGFKWVLTNRGTAEWAVWCRAKGGKRLTGAPPSGQQHKDHQTHKAQAVLTVLLSFSSFSITSISCSFWSGSRLKRREAEKLSTQGLQLFALRKISRDLQIELCHCVLRTQRCQCSQWFIFSSEREFLKTYNIRSLHLRADSHSLILISLSVCFYKSFIKFRENLRCCSSLLVCSKKNEEQMDWSVPVELLDSVSSRLPHVWRQISWCLLDGQHHDGNDYGNSDAG